MKLLEIWKRFGKQPLATTKYQDAKVFIDKKECIITKVSVIKNCSTCKNNVEFPPPHTCDICTSLDQEEEHEMWEAKD